MLFWELVFGFLGFICASSIKSEGPKGASVGLLIVAVFIAIGYFVFFPHFFVFDKKGVRIYYILGFREEAKWDDVRQIEKVTHFGVRTWHTVFVISPMESRNLFFMESEVNKTWYIRRIIEHYWDGTIDDDGLLARWRRRRAEPKNTFRADGEERKVKSEAHEVLKRYRGEFEALGVKLSVKFTYDGEEKRPESNYEYRVNLIFIGHGEDEKSEIETPLLRVIRGKKEFRPMAVRGAFDELEEILREELVSLEKLGREEYFAEL